jgi:hypothetical protein
MIALGMVSKAGKGLMGEGCTAVPDQGQNDRRIIKFNELITQRRRYMATARNQAQQADLTRGNDLAQDLIADPVQDSGGPATYARIMDEFRDKKMGGDPIEDGLQL